MIEHAYLSDPSFAEPNAGPWLEGKCGHELPVRDPSLDQIRRRCLAILRASPRRPVGEVRGWGVPTVLAPEWFNPELATNCEV